MKKLLIIVLLVTTLLSNEKSEKNATKVNYVDNPMQGLMDASAYLDSLNSEKNRDRAIEIYENSTHKVKLMAARSLVEFYCSERYRDELQCNYWLEKASDVNNTD